MPAADARAKIDRARQRIKESLADLERLIDDLDELGFDEARAQVWMARRRVEEADDYLEVDDDGECVSP